MPRKKVMRAHLEARRRYLTKKLFATVVNDIRISLGRELTEKAVDDLRTQIAAVWRDIARKKLSSHNQDQEANITGVGRQRSVHHLPRYLEGMGEVQIEGTRVRLKLRTFDALRLEYGWAPPSHPGSKLEDGIGKYDGQLHDMRPLLLYSGNAPKQTKRKREGEGWQKGGHKWKGSVEGRGVWEAGERNRSHDAPSGRTGASLMKVIKLELEGQSLDDLTQAVHSWLKGNLEYEAEKHIQKKNLSEEAADDIRASIGAKLRNRKRIWDKAMDAVVRDVNKRQRDRNSYDSAAMEEIDFDETYAGEKYNPWSPSKVKFDDPKKRLSPTTSFHWSEVMGEPVEVQHKNFLFRNLHVEPRPGQEGPHSKQSQYQLFTLRTISDSPKQLSKKRWFTTGTPPANIIANDPNGDDLVNKISNIISLRGLHRALEERLKKPTKVSETVKAPRLHTELYEEVAIQGIITPHAWHRKAFNALQKVDAPNDMVVAWLRTSEQEAKARQASVLEQAAVFGRAQKAAAAAAATITAPPPIAPPTPSGPPPLTPPAPNPVSALKRRREEGPSASALNKIERAESRVRPRGPVNDLNAVSASVHEDAFIARQEGRSAPKVRRYNLTKDWDE